MNRRSLMLAAVALVCLMQSALVAAEPVATHDEAVLMAKRAIAFIRKNGREQAFAAFNNPKGNFIDRELYVCVYDLGGKNLAHGANAKIIGKDMLDYRDPDGKFPIRESVELAKTKGSGWIEYKYLNPTTKEMQPKAAYIERFEDTFVLVGAYK